MTAMATLHRTNLYSSNLLEMDRKSLQINSSTTIWIHTKIIFHTSTTILNGTIAVTGDTTSQLMPGDEFALHYLLFTLHFIFRRELK
mmetsp:Transcript_36558/g.49460  ORF Transcript_36558/g.49460 Transcript_36558/m.49460 type:complete len:87 (+) Transcript_36558:1119-1379(+)